MINYVIKIDSFLIRCDRIIWYGKGIKQQLYTRGEVKISDHRPVKAIFTAEVGVLLTLKELQTFIPTPLTSFYADQASIFETKFIQ